MDITAKKAEYDASIQEASRAFLDQQFIRAATRYHDAFAVCKELQSTERINAGLLRYAMARCYYESHRQEDLAEGVMWLQTMDNELKAKIPAVYCLLAQFHCKLYRFDQAMEALRKGESIIRANSGSVKGMYYIPGTKIAISENDQNEVWARVRTECSTWHKPDAVCNSEECNNITRPYTTANRNIFKGDPAFSGMVIVSCNNKERPCCLKFHHSCWKSKKDELYPVQKVSDRDILGSVCFTPSCVHEDDSPCQISSIEVIDSEGSLKAHVKDPNLINRPLNKNLSKGAIKKVRLPPPPVKKVEDPPSMMRVQDPVRLPRDSRIDDTNLWGGYSRDQILTVTDNDSLSGIDFSNEPYEIAREKTVILAYFHGYIRNNTVKVSDLDSKYKSFSNGLSNLKNLDILAFLLQTGKFKVLDSPARNSLYQSHTSRPDYGNQNYSNCNSTQDIEDVYTELMNDIDSYEPRNEPVSRHEPPARNWNNNNIQSSSDVYKTSKSNFKTGVGGVGSAFHKYDAGSGDAPQLKPTPSVRPPQMMNYEPPRYDAENPAPPKSEQPERKATENRKLKEYAAQLEKQLEDTTKKIADLEREIKKKNDIINSHDNDKQGLYRKIEKLEHHSKLMEEIRRTNENLKRESAVMKNELAELTKEHARVKAELDDLNDPQKKKANVMKTFQEEYKILQDHINAEWEKETDILKGNLEAETENKMSLLNKSLEVQYASNKNYLEGNIQQCTTVIDVLNAINAWMANNIENKPVVDTSSWLSRLHTLQNILDEQESEYTRLLDEMNSDSVCKEKLLDINLGLPEIEAPPEEKLSNVVTKVLDNFYKNQCQLIQNLMKMTQQNQPVPNQQPAPPGYPMQGAYNYNNAGQFPMQYQQPRHPLMSAPLMNCPPQRPPPLMQTPMMPPQYPSFPPFAGPTPQTSAVNGLAPNLTRASVPRRSSTSSTDSTNQDQVKPGVVLRGAGGKSSLPTASANVSNHINGFPEKVSQVNKAFKAMSVEENNKTQGKVSNDTTSKGNDKGKIPTLSAVEQKSRSSSYIVTKPSSKPKQKVGIDVLLMLMKKKYPGTLEVDLVETLNDVRRKHNDSLNGLSVPQLLEEADGFLKKYQELHLLSYFPEEDVRPFSADPDAPAPPQARAQVNATPPPAPPARTTASSVPARKTVVSEPASKKTWNIVSHDEIKWESGEVTECPICFCSMDESNCYTLQCQHSFHHMCVKQWLVSDRSCPICRVLVTEDEEFPPLRA